MTIRGTIMVSNLNEKTKPKVMAKLKMFKNSLNVIRKNKNQEFYEGIMKSNMSEEETILYRKEIKKKYSLFPNLKIDFFDINHTNIEYINTFNSLKTNGVINVFPSVYINVYLFDGSIRTSKKAIFDLMESISRDYKCKIYMELEKSKDKDVHYQITFENGEKKLEECSYESILLQQKFIFR